PCPASSWDPFVCDSVKAAKTLVDVTVLLLGVGDVRLAPAPQPNCVGKCVLNRVSDVLRGGVGVTRSDCLRYPQLPLQRPTRESPLGHARLLVEDHERELGRLRSNLVVDAVVDERGEGRVVLEGVVDLVAH